MSLFFNVLIHRRALTAMSLIGLGFFISACGGSESTRPNESLNAVDRIEGEFQLVGTACSDGSSTIRFNEMIVSGVERFRKEYDNHFKSQKELIQQELEETSQTAEEDRVAELKSDLAMLPVRDDSVLLDIYGGWESALTTAEIFAKLQALSDQEWSSRLADFIGSDDGWPKQEMPFATEGRQTLWRNLQISLEQELGLARLRSPGTLADEFEFRMSYASDPVIAEPKDPLVQEVYQNLIQSCQNVVQTDFRPDLSEFINQDVDLFQQVQNELSDMRADSRGYLSSGVKQAASSRRDFLDYAATQKVKTSIEFVEDEVWLVSKNEGNACEQRFPVQAEYQEGQILNLRPSISYLAFCSEACGPVEKEVCDAFSAEVRSIFELIKRTEMSESEANARFNSQSKTVSFRFHRPKAETSAETAPIVLVRVSNLKKEALRVEATKSLRLVTKEEKAICPEGADTGFLLTPVLEYSGN